MPWDVKSFPTVEKSVFNYEKCCNDESVTKGFLTSIQKNGFVFLEGLEPSSLGGTLRAAELIGKPIHSGPPDPVYGNLYEFTSEKNSALSDMAYSTQGLPPHTDGTYMIQAPG